MVPLYCSRIYGERKEAKLSCLADGGGANLGSGPPGSKGKRGGTGLYSEPSGSKNSTRSSACGAHGRAHAWAARPQSKFRDSQGWHNAGLV
jgi:hypothetical protein